MATQTPMDVLRDLADKQLTESTLQLGKSRQQYTQANAQLKCLEDYEREYCDQLQLHATGQGISAIDLICRQSFIDSLHQVMSKQARQVQIYEVSVNEALMVWKKDKQRLNAFDALKERAEAARLMHESKLEQKSMDEFAQRVTLRKR